MSKGRIAAILLVLTGLLGGGAMYWLQVYGYYDRLEPRSLLLVEAEDGTRRLDIADYQGIDSTSSPLRLRECLTVLGETGGLVPYPAPEPLLAPGWFGCFDARALGRDLQSGAARAVLVEGNFIFGFDRVMALYQDGTARIWPQTNACGRAHFDGDPLPEGCPPAP